MRTKRDPTNKMKRFISLGFCYQITKQNLADQASRQIGHTPIITTDTAALRAGPEVQGKGK